jgi:hypothetical protein
LSSLDIHNSPSLSSSAFIDAIAHLPHLQNIRLSRSLITPRHALPAIVKHLPKLTQLTLLYAEDDIEPQDLSHVLLLTNLSSLNLECFHTSLDDEFIRTLSTRLTKLDSLHLSNAYVSKSLTSLSHLQMLTRLIVPHSFFGAHSPLSLPSGLLQIEAQFSDESVDALASHCGGLTSLIIAPCSSNISVNHWSTTLSDASLISVVRLPHLQSLSLHYDVSNKAMKTLQSLSTVKYLGLGYNNAVSTSYN